MSLTITYILVYVILCALLLHLCEPDISAFVPFYCNIVICGNIYSRDLLSITVYSPNTILADGPKDGHNVSHAVQDSYSVFQYCISS